MSLARFRFLAHCLEDACCLVTLESGVLAVAAEGPLTLESGALAVLAKGRLAPLVALTDFNFPRNKLGWLKFATLLIDL